MEAPDPSDESVEAPDPSDESVEGTDPSEESVEAPDPSDESVEGTDPSEELAVGTDPSEESAKKSTTTKSVSFSPTLPVVKSAFTGKYIEEFNNVFEIQLGEGCSRNSNQQTSGSGNTNQGRGATETTTQGKGATETTTQGKGATEITTQGKGATETTNQGQGATETTTQGKGATETTNQGQGATENTTQGPGATENTTQGSGATENTTQEEEATGTTTQSNSPGPSLGDNIFSPGPSIDIRSTTITSSAINQGTQGEQATQSPTSSENLSQDTEFLNRELLSILQSLSSGIVDRKNQQAIENKLHFLEKLLLIKEQNEGVNKDTEFLKKLIVTSQLQMNNIIRKLTSQNKDTTNLRFGKQYTQKPHIPNITQFKPSGTSNIFSPLIDIKTHDYNNNKKFSDAYERGFEKGLKEGDKLSISSSETKINDSSTKRGDQYINLGDRTNYQRDDTTFTQKGINFMGINNSSNKNNNLKMNDINSDYYKNGVNSRNGKSSVNTKNNGYIRGDNKGKLGIPGYSYLDPELWNVPKRRTPVCHQPNTDDRKPNSLDPAGYMHGGYSGVMEFHGVGSILPKFNYKENTKQIPDKLDRL